MADKQTKELDQKLTEVQLTLENDINLSLIHIFSLSSADADSAQDYRGYDVHLVPVAKRGRPGICLLYTSIRCKRDNRYSRRLGMSPAKYKLRRGITI